MAHPCIAKADKVLEFLKENIGESILDSEGADIIKHLQKVQRKSDAKIRNMTLVARAQKRLTAQLKDVADKDLQSYLNDMVAGAGRKDSTKMVSLERYIQGVTGIYYSRLAKEADKFRPKLASFGRTNDSMRNIVRALFGEAVQDADASAFAKVWKPVVEDLRLRFNKAGGNIEALDTWALPQRHDAARIGKTTFDEWFRTVEDMFDRKAMHLALTGEEGDLTNEVYQKVMKAIHASLASDGARPIQVKELSGIRTRGIASRHLEHRILHFKNAESWLKYNDMYGASDPFQAMMSHIEMMGREIGAMEMLGPNPDAMFEGLVRHVQGRTSKSAGRQARKSYNNVMGKTFGPRESLGMFFQAARHIQTGAKLPMAPIAALTDGGFTALTAAFNGLPVGRLMRRVYKNIFSGGQTDRIFASQLGLHYEHALNAAHGANRFADITGHTWSAIYADKMIRAGGLNHMTHAAQYTFGIEMLRSITEMIDNPAKYGKGSRLRKSLRRYGLDKHWDELVSAPRLNRDGVTYIDIPNMADETTAAKFVAMIKEETNYAVPEPGAKTRGILNQGTQANTVAGELFRTMTQFKSFPTTIVVTHLSRGISQGSLAGNLVYLAPLTVGLSVLGMGVVQVKEILKGNTGYDWSDPELFARGFAQGGAWGQVGDVWMTNLDKYGLTQEFMMGPAFEFIDESIGGLGIQGVKDVGTAFGAFLLHSDKSMAEAFDGMADKYLGKTSKFLAGNLPNTWYTKLAMEKSMIGYIRRLDPKNEDRNARLEKKLKEQNRGQWVNF